MLGSLRRPNLYNLKDGLINGFAAYLYALNRCLSIGGLSALSRPCQLTALAENEKALSTFRGAVLLVYKALIYLFLQRLHRVISFRINSIRFKVQSFISILFPH